MGVAQLTTGRQFARCRAASSPVSRSNTVFKQRSCVHQLRGEQRGGGALRHARCVRAAAKEGAQLQQKQQRNEEGEGGAAGVMAPKKAARRSLGGAFAI